MKQWHEVDLDPRDVIDMRGIMQHPTVLRDEMSYSALRSYATRRRTHQRYGPMPLPIARISNQPVWLRFMIDWWLDTSYRGYNTPQSKRKIKAERAHIIEAWDHLITHEQSWTI